MGSIFKKATGIVTDNGNVYECYNLKENPLYSARQTHIIC